MTSPTTRTSIPPTRSNAWTASPARCPATVRRDPHFARRTSCGGASPQPGCPIGTGSISPVRSSRMQRSSVMPTGTSSSPTATAPPRRSADFSSSLHGESVEAYPASDALCNALQVLNHLQDCGDDYRTLNRVYLPEDWLAEGGVEVEELGGPRSSAALRSVIDRCLDATVLLLASAELLPARLRNVRFAMEAAAIVSIAKQLGRELRRRDPLAERVELTRSRFGICCALGIGRVLLRRTFVRLRPAAAHRSRLGVPDGRRHP